MDHPAGREYATEALETTAGDCVSVRTPEGDMTLGFADSLDATVEVQVRDGEMDGPADVFDAVEERGSTYVRGVVGDGDAWLTAKTGSGDGTVERA